MIDQINPPSLKRIYLRAINNLLVNQIGWHVLWNTIVAGINLITLIFLAKKLSLESFGIYGLLVSVITFTQFLDAALNYSILRAANRAELVERLRSGRGITIVVYLFFLLLSVTILFASKQLIIPHFILAIGLTAYFYKIADLNILSSVRKFRGDFKHTYKFVPKYTAVTSICVLVMLVSVESQLYYDQLVMIGVASLYFLSMLLCLKMGSLKPVLRKDSLKATINSSGGLLILNFINAVNANGKNALLGLIGGNLQLGLFVLATQIPAKLMQLVQMTTEPLIRHFLSHKTKGEGSILSGFLAGIFVAIGLIVINFTSDTLFVKVLGLSVDQVNIAKNVLHFFSISLFLQSVTISISIYFIALHLDRYNIEASLANALSSFGYFIFCLVTTSSIDALDLSIAACVGSISSSTLLFYRLIYETNNTDSDS